MGTGKIELGPPTGLLLVLHSLLKLAELAFGREGAFGGANHFGTDLAQFFVQPIHGLHLLHDLLLMPHSLRRCFVVGLDRPRDAMVQTGTTPWHRQRPS